MDDGVFKCTTYYEVDLRPSAQCEGRENDKEGTGEVVVVVVVVVVRALLCFR